MRTPGSRTTAVEQALQLLNNSTVAHTREMSEPETPYEVELRYELRRHEIDRAEETKRIYHDQLLHAKRKKLDRLYKFMSQDWISFGIGLSWVILWGTVSATILRIVWHFWN
jgi:hypothetical protein